MSGEGDVPRWSHGDTCEDDQLLVLRNRLINETAEA